MAFTPVEALSGQLQRAQINAALSDVDTGGSGVSDGDKGDITVSASGATWTIDNQAVTAAKFQNIAQNRIIGRVTAGTGSVQALTAAEVQAMLGIAESFEKVSKNLEASNATLNYTGDALTSIVYANGITKTLNYSGDVLTTVVLSGTTPSGIDLTKTLTYSGDALTGAAYT